MHILKLSVFNQTLSHYDDMQSNQELKLPDKWSGVKSK